MFDEDLARVVRIRCRANMAHARQKRSWLPGESSSNLSRCSLFARKRLGKEVSFPPLVETGAPGISSPNPSTQRTSQGFRV